MVVFLW